jgi:hypothetical protein
LTKSFALSTETKDPFVDAAAAIRPLSAVRIARWHARLVRVELALKRRIDITRINAGSEKARGVRPDPARALRGFEYASMI